MRVRHKREFSTYKKWKEHLDFEIKIAQLAIRMGTNRDWDGIDLIFACEALRRLGDNHPNITIINYINNGRQ